MARLLLIGFLMAAFFVGGCNKNDEDLKAIEKEASKDDAGAVIDSLQGNVNASTGQQALGASSRDSAGADSSAVIRQEPAGQMSQESQPAANVSVKPGKTAQAPEAKPESAPSSASPPGSAPDSSPMEENLSGVKAGEYTVVIGSYAGDKIAEAMAAKYRERQFPAFVRNISIEGKTFYRLCVGSYPTITEARQIANTIKDRFSAEFWIDRGK
jgi:cell division septation protein DedD